MSHRYLYVGMVLLAIAGCAHRRHPGPAVPLANGIAPENPIFVPVTDHEFIWNQVVDTVDDYFQIEREDRVRFIGGVATEGRIDTVPLTAATILEPWRRDSTPGYEKLHATLQSVQRRAVVRVTPDADGCLIDVAVFKELEDVDRSEHSTVGSSTFRHDGSLVRNARWPDSKPVTLGWVSLGRDVTLEQRMIAEIRGRLAVGPQHRVLTPSHSLRIQ